MSAVQFDTLRIRFRNMDTDSLEQEFFTVSRLKSRSVADDIAQTLISEELDLRDREYTDWCSRITYEVE